MNHMIYLIFPALLFVSPVQLKNADGVPAAAAAPTFTLFFMKDTLPFREMPAYPDAYEPTTVAARMIEGLGFRYYWATEGLRPEDLSYRPSPEARASRETLVHIHGLSRMIVNAVRGEANLRPAPPAPADFSGLRRETLMLLQEASTLLRQSPPDGLGRMDIVFQRGDQRSSFPFWHQFNGPIADALWHVGQVVAFRRASGNPVSAKVSWFSGKLRE